MLSFLILVFFQIIVFAAALAKFPHKGNSTNRYLIFIFIGGTLAVLSKIGFYILSPESSMYETISSTLCFSAMSHLFIKEILSGKKIKNWHIAIHLIPFMLSVMSFSMALRHFFWPMDSLWWQPISIYIRLTTLIAYLIFDAMVIWRYRHRIKSLQGTINGGLITYFVMHKVLLTILLTLPHFNTNQYAIVYIGLLSMPVLLAVMVYYSVILRIYHKSKELEKSLANFIQEKAAMNAMHKKYTKSNPDDTKYKQLAERAKYYMEREKPYLEMDFSASQLAANLGVSQHELSLVINQHLGSSFYEFVNSYRIQYFIKNIQRIADGKSTILALAYEAGFSTKSTFNKYFKQIMGLSPSAYLEEHYGKAPKMSLSID